MNKTITLISLSLLFLNGFTQEATVKQLGREEIIWVILHPFSAKKAKKLSQLANHQTDSIQQIVNFKNPNSGGHLDALRHTYWMALLSQNIGYKRALWLGAAHEKKGIRDYKKKKLEDGYLSDEATFKMDSINNVFGAKIGKSCYKCSNHKLLQTSLDALRSGELKVIKQDSEGNFLSEKGKIIPDGRWQGRWKNRRTLVNSAY